MGRGGLALKAKKAAEEAALKLQPAAEEQPQPAEESRQPIEKPKSSPAQKPQPSAQQKPQDFKSWRQQMKEQKKNYRKQMNQKKKTGTWADDRPEKTEEARLKLQKPPPKKNKKKKKEQDDGTSEGKQRRKSSEGEGEVDAVGKPDKIEKSSKKRPESASASEDESAELKAQRKKEKKLKRDAGGDIDETLPPKKKKKKEESVETSRTVEAEAPAMEDPEAFKVVVAGIPMHIVEKTLRRDFGSCGEILSLRLLQDKETGKSRGMAFISFTNQEALEKALDYDGEDYGGRQLLVQVAKRAAGGSKGAGKGKSSLRHGSKPRGCKSVVLRGLTFSVTEADLTATFQACGEGPKNIKILLDKDTGKSKGMAFVDFDSETAVDEAIKLDGTELKGRRFQMDYATPRR